MAIRYVAPIDLGGNRISSVAAPTDPADAATKDYVDAAIRGLEWKTAVRAATTSAITLASPGPNIDGVTLNAGDRVLVKDQADATTNGVYVWNGAAAAMTRAADADGTGGNVAPGMAVSVEEGAVNADRTYLLVTDGAVTVGATALTFSQLGGKGLYSAGNGLTLSGSTFAVVAGTGLKSTAADVEIDTAVVVRKYAATVGDGAATTYTVAHNLGTRDVAVQVYTAGSPWATVTCTVERLDTNNVRVTFTTAPDVNAYRVVVHG